MLTLTRTFVPAAVCAALVAAAGCGGGAESPLAPSGSAGATIVGTVNGGNVSAMSAASAGPTAAAAPSGMTVSVVGTNVSAPVDILGQFELTGVPPGTVQLQFRAATVNATLQISNVGQEQLIQIRVTVSGSTATLESEERSVGKVTLCHRTEAGFYNLIEVGVPAEPAHRAHGDAKVGEPVPADPTKTFGPQCQLLGASVSIEKSTNGQDADEAPGPTVFVGDPITWTYVVTNTGSVDLTNVVVVDDRGVTVTCGQTTLAAGLSMTCTGSGVATLGQYRNVGTVTASWSGGQVTDSDASHYLGVLPDEEEDGPKVQLCHKRGNGDYHMIEVSVNAEPAHRAHGDGKIGEAVPGSPGKVFGPGCTVR